jgi:hypothetical protein
VSVDEKSLTPNRDPVHFFFLFSFFFRRIAGSPDRRIAGSPDRRIAGSSDRR